MVTMTVQELITELCHKNNFYSNDILKQIEFARPLIFDFDYPFYSNTRKPKFEELFLQHFLFREIAMETPYAWYVKLVSTFNLIMPYYNQLFESTLYSYNPFENYLTEVEHYEKGGQSDNIESTEDGTLSRTDDISVDKHSTEENTDVYTETNTENGTDKNDYGKVSTDGGTDTKTSKLNIERSRDDDTEHTLSLESDTPQSNISGSGNPIIGMVSGNSYNNQYTSKANDTATIRSYKDTEKTVGDGNTDSTTYGKKTTLSGSDTTTKENNIDINSSRDKNITLSGNEVTDLSRNDATHNETKTDKLQAYLRKYVTKSSGLQGNYSRQDLLLKLRNTFINVENMIFSDINVKDLFLMILE